MGTAYGTFAQIATAVLLWTPNAAFQPLPARSLGRHPTPSRLYSTGINTSFMWNAGLSYGKGSFAFYRNFNDMMKVFPDEDRQAYPEIFNLPKGVYEVRLNKPLGIVFEEIETGRGLYVQDLVEGGNAEREGTIRPGDVLVGMSAVKIVGAKYERRMIPARNFDFDTMVGAVSSNDPKWSCDDVMIMVERPGEADSTKVDQFMSFFEPPIDNPWKQPQ
ncbi:hypothetical protein FisN_23Hh203 [Fistulifera solaris]|jgi:hypothetical protein|uniref:PDZ domain-containing protein n=1 Tax=Fistulifera solaris TaxID=1519565 RepID=A0A1Z5JWA0_FISSO|nr:hypothetical protein FisN_23Hh203 [Fistulifera solaris]|eukprot:GAX18310.1 hypothetical protein FisN_23Hh203 [Fistulifera solaris]